jgi:hypothetical protein
VSDDLNPYASPQAVVAADHEARPRRRGEEGPSGLPSARAIWGWLAGVGMLGCALGLASRAVRPFFGGPMHWEAIATLVLLFVLCAGFVLWLWREQRKAALLSYQIGTFALWAGHTVGWSLLHGFLWEDLLVLNAGSWLASAVVGSLLLLIPHRCKIREG